MCGNPRGTRCAGDTRDVCNVAVADYRGAYPSGPGVDPVDGAQAAIDAAKFSPAEIDHLTASGANVLSAQQELEAARAKVAEGQRALTDASHDYNRERQATANALSDARASYRNASSEALAAQDALMEHTIRVYSETTGQDASYMRRELESHYDISYLLPGNRDASGADTSLGHAPPAPLPSDREAVEAAKRDTQFSQAYARAQVAATQARAAQAHYAEQGQRHGEAIRNRPAPMREAETALVVADDHMTTKERELHVAQIENTFTRAQVESGVGSVATRKALSEVRPDDVMINPDGSTNAWVYRKPDGEHPDGSFTPVVAVAGDNVRGLVTADGHVLTATTKELWTGRRLADQRNDFTVALTPPRPGATPAITSAARPAPFHVIS